MPVVAVSSLPTLSTPVIAGLILLTKSPLRTCTDAESLWALPPPLVAVTRQITFWLTRAADSTPDEAPVANCTPLASQAFESVGEPVQVPLEHVSVPPTLAVPEIAGLVWLGALAFGVAWADHE